MTRKYKAQNGYIFQEKVILSILGFQIPGIYRISHDNLPSARSSPTQRTRNPITKRPMLMEIEFVKSEETICCRLHCSRVVEAMKWPVRLIPYL